MKKAVVLALAMTVLVALAAGCGPAPDGVKIDDTVLRYIFSYSGLTMEQRCEMDEKCPAGQDGRYYLEDFPALAAATDAFMQENGLAVNQEYLDTIQAITIWYNGEYNVVELGCRDGRSETVLLPYGIKIMSLGDIRHLKSLVWFEAHILSAVSLEPLTDMPQLEGLYINADRVADMRPVSEMTWLKALGLTEARGISSALLEPLTGLEALSLNGVRLDSLDFLDSLDKLERLALEYVSLDTGSATSIARLPSLKSLVIDHTPMGRLDALWGIQLDYYSQDGRDICGP